MTTSELGIEGRIDKRVYDTAQLRDSFDSWDTLTKTEKLELTREVEPIEEETIWNVTTDSLHQYFVDNLNPDNTDPEANVSASWLGLGIDGGSGVNTSDADLNNRVYSEQVTSHSDNGKELLASTFLDSGEANGNTLDEIGLFSGDPANLANADVFLLNHATFTSVTKDNSKTVTFDVTLTFSDV